MIKQGYSSPEYWKVYEEKGKINFGSEAPTTIVRGNIDVSTIYPFTTQPLVYIPYLCTYKHNGYVSGVFITDPLEENVTLDYLKLLECDNVKVEPYKTHAVVDLQSYDSAKLPTNHKRNIKKAKDSNLFVGVATDPIKYHGTIKLNYDTLKDRHNIQDSSWTNYTYLQIEQLLKVPGAVVFTVLEEREDCAGQWVYNTSLFFIDRDNVYYHLSCQSDEGYKHNSNFIMMDEAIMFFKRLGLNKLLIGGVADGSDPNNGLWRFKKGFANETRQNYIVKVIYDVEKYNELSQGKEGNFFPLYRS